MKNNKLWATGLSALFLSTTILSGAASAVGPVPATSTETPAKTDAEIRTEAVTALTNAINKEVKTDGISSTVKTSYTNALNAAKEINTETAALKDIQDATAALTSAIEKVTEEAEKIENKATALRTLTTQVVDTISKPVAKVAAYAEAKANAYTALGKTPRTLSSLTTAYNELDQAITAINAAAKVYPYGLGADKEATIKMYDAAGNFISSSTIKADTQTIEIADVKDLTKYGLDVKSGFVLTSSGLPVNDDAVEKLTVAQKADATFTNVKVRVNFLKDGIPYSVAEVKNTDLISGIAGTTYSAKSIVEKFIPTADQEAVERDYLTDGYTYEDKKYTLDSTKYIQEITINIVKEAPKPPSVRMPSVSSFNGYAFKAGVKYSLSNQLELFYNQNGELNEKNYKIEPTAVYDSKASTATRRNLIITKPDGKKYMVFPKAGRNYIVKFKVTPKDGYRFHDGNKNILKENAAYFSNTASSYDSAPIISGIKSGTFTKGTFTKADYLKGISAFDFVDNKPVTVRHSSPVKASVPGTYKVTYKATDSKGFTATKTRVITVK